MNNQGKERAVKPGAKEGTLNTAEENATKEADSARRQGHACGSGAEGGAFDVVGSAQGTGEQKSRWGKLTIGARPADPFRDALPACDDEEGYKHTRAFRGEVPHGSPLMVPAEAGAGPTTEKHACPDHGVEPSQGCNYCGPDGVTHGRDAHGGRLCHAARGFVADEVLRGKRQLVEVDCPVCIDLLEHGRAAEAIPCDVPEADEDAGPVSMRGEQIRAQQVKESLRVLCVQTIERAGRGLDVEADLVAGGIYAAIFVLQATLAIVSGCGLASYAPDAFLTLWRMLGLLGARATRETILAEATKIAVGPVHRLARIRPEVRRVGELRARLVSDLCAAVRHSVLAAGLLLDGRETSAAWRWRKAFFGLVLAGVEERALRWAEIAVEVAVTKGLLASQIKTAREIVLPLSLESIRAAKTSVLPWRIAEVKGAGIDEARFSEAMRQAGLSHADAQSVIDAYHHGLKVGALRAFLTAQGIAATDAEIEVRVEADALGISQVVSEWPWARVRTLEEMRRAAVDLLLEARNDDQKRRISAWLARSICVLLAFVLIACSGSVDAEPGAGCECVGAEAGDVCGQSAEGVCRSGRCWAREAGAMVEIEPCAEGGA